MITPDPLNIHTLAVDSLRRPVAYNASCATLRVSFFLAVVCVDLVTLTAGFGFSAFLTVTFFAADSFLTAVAFAGAAAFFTVAVFFALGF